jgi:predicted Rossmann-fold nucleotide-binding protein
MHDHSIRDALDEFLETQRGKRVVGVMGGHSMARTHPRYEVVASIAQRLAERDYLIISGGGPGAMEAAHLGVSLAGRGRETLEAAIRQLSVAPTYQDERWLQTAWSVRETFRLAESRHRSLGIPTWLYGHEPPTPFATDIAKYFANSAREAGLVTIAHDGLIFAPGSAGTIQEIFQDAAQNHYATTGYASPMVFLDEEYWSRTKPVFPILKELAAGKPYAELLSIHDTAESVVERLTSIAPIRIEGAEWSFCDAHCADE